jgi:YD repeat-containing protein
MLLALLSFTPLARAQEVRYLYDELNRLIGVIDPQGNAAEYVYDAVGNILQIRRFNVDPNATLAISLVSPNKGSAGTQVQFFGKGFSPTLGDNQVSFNGIPATVTAASAMSLTTTVPSGATTGALTVTVAANTATAPEPFTVLQTLAILPEEATVFFGRPYSFQATLDGTPTPDVTWRVNGLVGGDSQVGTISPDGLYTPPSGPLTSGVTVEAVLIADPTRVATAPVTFAPAGTASSAAARLSVAPAPAAASTQGTLTAPALSIVGAVASPPLTANPLPASSLSVGVLPVITAVSPGSGSRGTSVGLTLTGLGLEAATALTILRDGNPDSLITVSGLTPDPGGASLTVTLTIDATAPVGGRILRVTAGGATSTAVGTGRNSFTVQ